MSDLEKDPKEPTPEAAGGLPAEEQGSDSADESPSEWPKPISADPSPSQEAESEPADESPTEEEVQDSADESPSEQPRSISAERSPTDGAESEPVEETPTEGHVRDSADKSLTEEQVQDSADESPSERPRSISAEQSPTDEAEPEPAEPPSPKEAGPGSNITPWDGTRPAWDDEKLESVWTSPPRFAVDSPNIGPGGSANEVAIVGPFGVGGANEKEKTAAGAQGLGEEWEFGPGAGEAYSDIMEYLLKKEILQPGPRLTVTMELWGTWRPNFVETFEDLMKDTLNALLNTGMEVDPNRGIGREVVILCGKHLKKVDEGMKCAMGAIDELRAQAYAELRDTVEELEEDHNRRAKVVVQEAMNKCREYISANEELKKELHYSQVSVDSLREQQVHLKDEIARHSELELKLLQMSQQRDIWRQRCDEYEKDLIRMEEMKAYLDEKTEKKFKMVKKHATRRQAELRATIKELEGEKGDNEMEIMLLKARDKELSQALEDRTIAAKAAENDFEVLWEKIQAKDEETEKIEAVLRRCEAEIQQYKDRDLASNDPAMAQLRALQKEMDLASFMDDGDGACCVSHAVPAGEPIELQQEVEELKHEMRIKKAETDGLQKKIRQLETAVASKERALEAEASKFKKLQGKLEEAANSAAPAPGDSDSTAKAPATSGGFLSSLFGDKVDELRDQMRVKNAEIDGLKEKIKQIETTVADKERALETEASKIKRLRGELEEAAKSASPSGASSSSGTNAPTITNTSGGFLGGLFGGGPGKSDGAAHILSDMEERELKDLEGKDRERLDEIARLEKQLAANSAELGRAQAKLVKMEEERDHNRELAESASDDPTIVMDLQAKYDEIYFKNAEIEAQYKSLEARREDLAKALDVAEEKREALLRQMEELQGASLAQSKADAEKIKNLEKKLKRAQSSKMAYIESATRLRVKAQKLERDLQRTQDELVRYKKAAAENPGKAPEPVVRDSMTPEPVTRLSTASPGFLTPRTLNPEWNATPPPPRPATPPAAPPPPAAAAAAAYGVAGERRPQPIYTMLDILEILINLFCQLPKNARVVALFLLSWVRFVFFHVRERIWPTKRNKYARPLPAPPLRRIPDGDMAAVVFFIFVVATVLMNMAVSRERHLWLGANSSRQRAYVVDLNNQSPYSRWFPFDVDWRFVNQYSPRVSAPSMPRWDLHVWEHIRAWASIVNSFIAQMLNAIA